MRTVIAGILILSSASSAFAGMPAPLPDNPPRYFHLGETPFVRLQTLSFFLMVFFLCSASFMLLWNYVRRDLTFLPKLTFGRSTAFVFLWGLLFVIVLTMISGARELMTPGAWKKQGFTYQLTPNPTAPAEDPTSEPVRRQHLEKLRSALMTFAAMHEGRFPQSAEQSAIPAELWQMPQLGQLPYFYKPGLTARGQPALLAYEPEIDSNRRLVLKTNGDIVMMTSSEIGTIAASEKSP